MKSLQELKDRWKAETPELFKKIRGLSIKVGVAAAAIWMVNSSMGLALDPAILAVCKYSLAVCAATGLMSQITKTDTNGNA